MESREVSRRRYLLRNVTMRHASVVTDTPTTVDECLELSLPRLSASMLYRRSISDESFFPRYLNVQPSNEVCENSTEDPSKNVITDCGTIVVIAYINSGS